MISTRCIYQRVKLIKVNQTSDQNNLTSTVKRILVNTTDPEGVLKNVRINEVRVLSGLNLAKM